jgi:hypothetical protein
MHITHPTHIVLLELMTLINSGALNNVICSISITAPLYVKNIPFRNMTGCHSSE